MLVLTRKADQTICIGSEIHITILHVLKNRAEIGIEAPSKVRVRRGKLLAPPDARQISKAIDSDHSVLETASTTALSTHALHVAMR